MEKQTLEKECNQFQEECLREESRYHQLQNLINITKIRYDRCEQEKKWQHGQGRLMRDFASLKELYTNKLAQQEQLTKQLRKRQKELKENSGALTNQKTNFMVCYTYTFIYYIYILNMIIITYIILSLYYCYDILYMPLFCSFIIFKK
jgi:anion-transporting  ArsA/GET3 family ATPase